MNDRLNKTLILCKELSLHSCPSVEYGWKARGGCNKACDTRYSQAVAVECWNKWSNELTNS